MDRYNFKKTETKWQKEWVKSELYKSEIDRSKPKYYVLEMFPYPSGRIHMGHVRNYTMGDVVARYMKARGYNILHPMGGMLLECPQKTQQWKIIFTLEIGLIKILKI